MNDPGPDPELPPITSLSKKQRRVLGTLIEKALTVPDSYPLTVNSLISGSNQKSNRSPLTNYDETDIEEVSREDFPDFEEMEVGMEIEVVDEDGDIIEATIKEIRPDAIVLDFNSDLAGKSLTYHVQVVAVREADEDEIEMGLPASMMDDLLDDVYEEE